ncbi:MAG: hypothetical protein CL840_17675 [Crocinitomicaceae bacterium]|nr:hypothetical protein [Crocinitomicaceae bacterium]|tara:strand:+ start:1695 stop:2537 length:843 start_codon:yes stop_codon:yes gene_type:complete
MKTTLYIIATLFLFSSCTEKIDFEVDSEQTRLVVEGQITTLKMKHLVKVTQSTSYFYEQAAPVVTGAAVSITDGSSTWVLTEEKPGFYYTSETAFPADKSYTLNIEADGQKYEATDFLNAPITADSVAVVSNEEWDFENNTKKDFYSIHFFVQEPAGLGDNYLWKYWLKRPDSAWKDMTPEYSEWVFATDEYVDGNSPEKGWEMFSYIPKEEMPNGTKVRVEMYKITTLYYKFLYSVGEQTQRTGFFDGPPANITTNLSNRALGFFFAAGADTISTVVQE